MVVSGPATRYGESVTVIKPPVQGLVIRRERTGNLVIAQRELSQWLTKNGVSIRRFFIELKECGVSVDTSRFAALGRGTDYGSAQALICVIDGNHPMLSGVVREVETKAQSDLGSLPSPP